MGMGYITPVATIAKWFPDRRGLMTGVAVAGYGAGAPHHEPVCRAVDCGARRARDVRHPRHRLTSR